MARPYAYLVSLSLLVLVVWPAFRDPNADSFPLSTYPMFSQDRPRHMRIVHAVGVLPGGGRVPLPPRITSDNPEVLQSMATIWRAVRGGPSRRRRFCRKLARRVSQAQGRPLRSVTRVELATSHFDAIEYFEHGPEPLSRNIHARCEVP